MKKANADRAVEEKRHIASLGSEEKKEYLAQKKRQAETKKQQVAEMKLQKARLQEDQLQKAKDILGAEKENSIRQGVVAAAHELDSEGSDEDDHLWFQSPL